MKLKVIQKGTHYVAIKDINNDVPTPASIVAEYLSSVEYYLQEMIKKGGSDHDVSALVSNIQTLNTALIDASAQNWKLELEQ